MKLKTRHVSVRALTGGAVIAFVSGCSSDQTAQPTLTETDSNAAVAHVELSNPSNFAREQQPVFFSLYNLGVEEGSAKARNLAVQLDGDYIPSQLIDRDGDGTEDGVFLLVDFAPQETLNLVIQNDPDADVDSPKLSQAEISRKTGGEWQPREKNPELQEYVGGTFENVDQLSTPPGHTDHSYFIRYEGPGIESDKVGYRVYLDPRNGFDIFGKKTGEMVLQDVGQDGFDSYHEMADWGMDILKVGSSLGAGGYGFWDGESVQLVSDVGSWDVNIVESGGLYSQFEIVYNDWSIADKKLDLTANLSMHGGSRMVHTRLDLEEELPNLAIGLVKHPGTELITGSTETTGKAWTYIASWGRQSLNDDNLGMAVIFQKGDLDKQVTDANNYVAVMDPSGQDLEYYFLAAWEQEANGIKTKEEFVEYLEREVEKLTLAPRENLDTAQSQEAKSLPVDAEGALKWAKKLADSELERKALGYHYGGWDVNRERDPKFEYDIVGLLPLAYDELAKVTDDERYGQVIEKVTGSYITDDGDIRNYKLSNYNIDSVAPARNLLRLYERTGEEKYKKAMDLVRRQLEEHPRTSEGAFWHKERYPWQLWLDGVYMGMPFLAGYTQQFEDGHALEEVVKEFELTRKYLRDEETGLYYHAWDEKKQQEWADPETGLSGYYWGRGFGWLTMALVDVLEIIPETETELREPLLQMVEEIAVALKNYQDEETGTWWQIMDMPDAPGNYRESSATSMFTYFYAKAINNGYLPESYKDVANKAYNGAVNEFILVHPDGNVSLTNICLVAGLGYGRDGSYEYYMSEPVWMNDPKGTGPFILAGVEMHKLLQKQ